MSKTITITDSTLDKIKNQVQEETKDVKEKKKINITIKDRFTGAIIWESEKTTYKEAVEDANLEGTNLEYANLEGANLKGVNLEYANLKDANLEGANLKGANLKGVNLEYANLKDANLEGANLKDANLRDANLKDADLKDADLGGVKTVYCKINFSSSEYPQAKQFIEGLKL